MSENNQMTVLYRGVVFVVEPTIDGRVYEVDNKYLRPYLLRTREGCSDAIYAPSLDNLLLWWKSYIDYALDHRIPLDSQNSASLSLSLFPRALRGELEDKYGIVRI